MKEIFYFIGIIFIIYELIWLMMPNVQIKKIKEFKEEVERNKGKKWGDYSDEYRNLSITRGLKSFIFALWLFGGLLTFNWFAFLIIIIFNFLIIAPISKLTEYSRVYTGLHWFNSLVGFSFGIFIIINTYHLKIDLYAWFLRLF